MSEVQKNKTDVKAGVDKKVDAKADAPEVKRGPGRQKSEGPTISSVAYAAIKAGKSNEEALAEVKKAFPESNTKVASINWYRNQARIDDPSIPTSRDITTARNAEQKAKDKAEKAKAKADAKAEKAKGKSDAGAAGADPTA